MLMFLTIRTRSGVRMLMFLTIRTRSGVRMLMFLTIRTRSGVQACQSTPAGVQACQSTPAAPVHPYAPRQRLKRRTTPAQPWPVVLYPRAPWRRCTAF